MKTGDEIPADGLVLESNELKVDESVMTGESELIDKDTVAKCIIQRD